MSCELYKSEVYVVCKSNYDLFAVSKKGLIEFSPNINEAEKMTRATAEKLVRLSQQAYGNRPGNDWVVLHIEHIDIAKILMT